MTVVCVNIVVPNLDKVLKVFTHIKVYRSATLDGTYAEITTSGIRPALEKGKTTYTYIDETAPSEDVYYKCSYYNTTTGLESSLSDAVQGDGDPALDIISITELKTYYLFGLDLTNDEGTPYPDELYQWFIKSAVSWVEHKLDMPLRPKIIKDERHDYVSPDYDQYGFFKTKEYPILSVSEVRLVLPANNTIYTYDPSWIQVEKEGGHVQLVPSQMGTGPVLLGLVNPWYAVRGCTPRSIPATFRIDYTAGFEKVPDILKDLVGKVASFGPLNIAGDLLGGAGIASQTISMDGLSQTYNTTSSATNAGYGARLLQYQKEIKEVIPTLRRYYKDHGLTVI